MSIYAARLVLMLAVFGTLPAAIGPAIAQSVPALLPAARLSAQQQMTRSLVAVQTVSYGISQGMLDAHQRERMEALEREKAAALAALDAAIANGRQGVAQAQARLDQARSAFEVQVDQLADANQGLQRVIEAMRETMAVSLPTLTEEEVRLRQRFADGDRVGTRAIMEKLDADWDAAAQLSLERAQAQLARTTNLQRAARKRDTAARAAISVSKGDVGATSLQVLELWDQAAALDENDFRTHIERARLAQTIGNLPRARAAAEDGARAAKADWERGTAQNELGHIAVLQGDLSAAESAYQESLRVYRGLVAVSPDKTWLSRNLSGNLTDIGDVAIARGDLAGANAAYSESLVIVRRLSAADPSSAQAQRDVSVGLQRSGDVAVAHGDLVGASAAYSESLVIARRLSAADPSSAQIQSDVLIGLNKIGDIAVARGDLEGASAAYRESAMIARRLSVADPSSAQAQRDVLVGLGRVGNVASARGNLSEAITAYGESLAIARRLSAADPSSAQAQRDESVSLNNVGKVAFLRGDLLGASAAHSEGLDIRRRLSMADLSSAQARRDVGESLFRLAQIQGSTIQWAEVAAHWRAMKRDGVLAPSDEGALNTIEEGAAVEAAVLAAILAMPR